MGEPLSNVSARLSPAKPRCREDATWVSMGSGAPSVPVGDVKYRFRALGGGDRSRVRETTCFHTPLLLEIHSNIQTENRMSRIWIPNQTTHMVSASYNRNIRHINAFESNRKLTKCQEAAWQRSCCPGGRSSDLKSNLHYQTFECDAPAKKNNKLCSTARVAIKLSKTRIVNNKVEPQS
jgi:hypothetical protein